MATKKKKKTLAERARALFSGAAEKEEERLTGKKTKQGPKPSAKKEAPSTKPTKTAPKPAPKPARVVPKEPAKKAPVALKKPAKGAADKEASDVDAALAKQKENLENMRESVRKQKEYNRGLRKLDRTTDRALEEKLKMREAREKSKASDERLKGVQMKDKKPSEAKDQEELGNMAERDINKLKDRGASQAEIEELGSTYLKMGEELFGGKKKKKTSKFKATTKK